MKTVALKKSLIYSGSLILVNERRPYREDAAERSLAPVNPGVSPVLLEANALKSLSRVMGELGGWERIAAVSGWRSSREQREIYKRSLIDNGAEFTKKYVALPGHSEHQTGLAIDLALKQRNIDFLRPHFPYTGICQEFRRRALAFGFIERYAKDKESVTKIAHEPWHFRYVGAPHAGIMARRGLALEEYIDLLKGYPYGESHYSCAAGEMRVSISYLKANLESDTELQIDDGASYSVSGDNADGFILTEWRKMDGRR